MGRVVITHSTYLEGLIPLLKQLAKDPQVVTVTPAVISRVKGRCQGLKLRISTPITGGAQSGGAARHQRPRGVCDHPPGAQRVAAAA